MLFAHERYFQVQRFHRQCVLPTPIRVGFGLDLVELVKDFHPLTPYPASDADWDVVQFIDPDTSEAVILAYRVRGETDSLLIRPRRLDPDVTYRITDPFSSRKPKQATGRDLTQKGLRISLKPESAAVRHLIPLR